MRGRGGRYSSLARAVVGVGGISVLFVVAGYFFVFFGFFGRVARGVAGFRVV